MPKGVPDKRYTGEFMQMVVETMHNEKLSSVEVARRFRVAKCDWERIYLTEGSEALHIERRGRGSKDNHQGRPSKFDKKLEEYLLAETQRMSAEIVATMKTRADMATVASRMSYITEEY
jgi:transposase